MAEYYKKFDQLNDELKNNKLIDLQYFELEEGLSMAHIKVVEEEFKITFSDEIRKFYTLVGSLNFMWTLKEDTTIKLLKSHEPGNVNGKANIVDPYTVLAGINDTPATPWKDILWFDDMEKDELEEAQALRAIDFFDNHNGECVGYEIDQIALEKPLIHLKTKNNSIIPMDINLEKYLDLLLQSKGFVRFQTAFLFPKSVEHETLKYYFHQIFPSAPLPDFNL